jgi:hypothetical protein
MATYGRDQAELESAVAIAHQRVYRAYNLAVQQGAEGVAEDLSQLAVELARVGESLLGARPRSRAALRAAVRRSA